MFGSNLTACGMKQACSGLVPNPGESCLEGKLVHGSEARASMAICTLSNIHIGPVHNEIQKVYQDTGGPHVERSQSPLVPAAQQHDRPQAFCKFSG